MNDLKRKKKLDAFDKLLTIMDELRENCPWDKKQTIESIRHLTIEETYELSDAISYLLNNKNKWNEIGKRNQEIIKEKYSKSNIDILVNIINSF